MVATLGILNINKKVLDLPNLIDNTNPVQTKIGIKYFELSNHASAPLSTGLGNVLTTISDRKIEHGSGSTVEYYTADIISATDYYPFGFAMDKRNFSSSDYRFGFNGMEKDDEMIGSGNSYTTYFRQYDPRLGRWKCMDPIIFLYPL
jgi:RHS repeat-associated protein